MSINMTYVFVDVDVAVVAEIADAVDVLVDMMSAVRVQEFSVNLD